MLPKNEERLPMAKKLRKEMTPQERKLWYLFLRTYPLKIYKQKIIGDYIVDFYCDKAKLVIEIDGSQHYDEEGMCRDKKRTAVLRGLGLEVVRYSNADVNCRFPAVCRDIDRRIAERSDLGSPGGELSAEPTERG